MKERLSRTFSPSFGGALVYIPDAPFLLRYCSVPLKRACGFSSPEKNGKSELDNLAKSDTKQNES